MHALVSLPRTCSRTTPWLVVPVDDKKIARQVQKAEKFGPKIRGSFFYFSQPFVARARERVCLHSAAKFAKEKDECGWRKRKPFACSHSFLIFCFCFFLQLDRSMIYFAPGAGWFIQTHAAASTLMSLLALLLLLFPSFFLFFLFSFFSFFLSFFLLFFQMDHHDEKVAFAMRQGGLFWWC